MSLLNAWIGPEEALVAVDTDGIRRDGTRKPMSKLFAVPHINAVIGFRGQSAFFSTLAQCCIAVPLESFDELLAELPSLLIWADASVSKALLVPGADGNEMVAVGWSEERGRMFGRIFSKRGDAEEFTSRDTQGFLAPFDIAAMPAIARTVDNLDAIARAQVRYMSAAGVTCGGRLIVAKATRDAVSVRHALTFGGESYADLRPAA